MMLEPQIFAKNTERFIISSNSTKDSNFDNLHYRINTLFNTFIGCVAQGLGICTEQINVASYLHDSNRYSYAIQVTAKNTGGIINSLMIDHIFPTAMACIKIKYHLSPTHQSAVAFQDDKVVLCNAYNQPCIFEKDTWLLYKNNLEIDAAICKIVDCLSSKKGVQEIIFALGDDIVSLSGTKIFDVALPFKEYAVDYTETINTGLLIKKADFDCTGSWEFKSGNEIIKARIHPSQRKKLHHIVNTCILGNRYLSVSLSLSCKLDIMGHCIPSTKKYEIIDIFGEPRSTTERPELAFKINEYPITTNLTSHKQLYLI